MSQQPTRSATDWTTYRFLLSRRVISLSLLIIPIMVLYITGHIDASPKTPYEELYKSNYTILGLTIGECFRHDILSKLGPALKIRDENDPSIESYCQMLCMTLGGDPFFNNAINKLYSSDYFCESFRMVQLDPSFLGTAT